LDGKVYVNATVDSNRDAKPIGEVAPFSVPHTAESEEQFVSVPLSSAMLATGAGLEQPPAVPKLSRDTVTDSSPSQRFNINKLLFRNGNGYTLSLSGSWSVNSERCEYLQRDHRRADEQAVLATVHRLCAGQLVELPTGAIPGGFRADGMAE
jgi:hypothetical protein